MSLLPLPSLTDIPEAERTATVELLLSICHQQQAQLLEQAEQLALQAEQIQQLKDEIALLKGEKGRPQLKPSGLTKPRPKPVEGAEELPRKRGKPVRKKTAELEIHQEQVLQPQAPLPAGTQFKGYEEHTRW